ncbi:DUF4212 domain-containing protein [Parvularcula sp. ZS-1/3]|uniref:DUF4212 domain-containing protein n=1 Tax=Parvularcula mediterranea TaxID=2732508 RepID=A0A7Y3RK55_9PROT|nr:DUF4212 domain-containing protein [Parvularcula mediterranea]NNU15553.1 DUF4212 domain-containing protein [Parvularcula mediterranea]
MSATTIKDVASGEKADVPPKLSYWAENLRLLGGLLAIWFTVSFGFGILLRDLLDNFSILGVPAGFWFAQQGSIYVFIALIFYYSRAIHKIEQKHGVDDDEEGASS